MVKKFVLTRDMCPIHYNARDKEQPSSAIFMCPLPLGFKDIVSKHLPELQEKIAKIVNAVNSKMLNLEPPFENILIEYQDRSEKDQIELLDGFQIKDAMIDHRGLYVVAIHGAYGDVYLDSNAHQYSDFVSHGFRRFFEPGVAFQCHNVDYYWQALLTREVVVKYFNLLSSLAVEGDK